MTRGMTGYAQPLRAIGQALEVLNIQNFELEAVDGNYFIRGHTLRPSEKLIDNQLGDEKLEAIWGRRAAQGLGDRKGRHGLAGPSSLELCYTAQDVERLDAEGQLRRERSEAMADAASLSQVLRCVGAYLNQKRARLCKISRDVDCLWVEYESSLGNMMTESFRMKDLYDLWVRMYLQRSTRVSH